MASPREEADGSGVRGSRGGAPGLAPKMMLQKLAEPELANSRDEHPPVFTIWSVVQKQIFQECGESIDIFAKEPRRLGKCSQVVARTTVEVLGLAPVTAGACLN